MRFLALLFLLMSCFVRAATPSMISQNCHRLVMLAGQGEDATEKYILYIRHFVEDKNALDLGDFKLLRGFSRASNLAQVFAQKISENYIYHDAIEELLPFVDMNRVHQFLDDLILNAEKEQGAKERAHKETKSVIGYFPIIQNMPEVKWPLNGPFMIKRNIGGTHFLSAEEQDDKSFAVQIDPSVGAIFYNISGTKAWHLDTGKEIELEGAKEQEYFRSITRFKNQEYVVHSVFPNEVRVYNQKTGKLFLEFKSNEVEKDLQKKLFILEETYLFLDTNKKPHLAWIKPKSNEERLSYDIQIAAQDFKAPQDISLPNVKYAEHIKMYSTKEGRLFGAFNFVDTDSTNKLSLIDVSKSGENLITVKIPERYFVENLVQKDEDNFVVFLMHDTPQPLRMKTINISRKNNAATWQAVPFEFKNLTVDYYTSPNAFQTRNGDIYYLLANNNNENAVLLKNGVRTGIKIDKYLEHITTLYRPNGAPLLVGTDVTEPLTYVIYDVEEKVRRELVFDSNDPRLRNRGLFGARYTSSGQILFYLGSMEPSNDLITTMQVYGPFNPKTGEAGP
jgi:hypothetical protein